MLKKSKVRLPVQFAHETATAPLRIVIVYNVFADMVSFYEMWSQVLARFMHEIEFHSCAWSFSMLRDPVLRDLSASYTAEADMVVFSAGGETPLPDHIKDWIRAWLPGKTNRRDALVAMLDGEPVQHELAPKLYDFLQETAERGGMEFFYKTSHRSPIEEVGVGAQYS